MTILGDSVGANGCSPEELREEERAQEGRSRLLVSAANSPKCSFSALSAFSGARNEEQILALERRTGYSSWTDNEGRVFSAFSGFLILSAQRIFRSDTSCPGSWLRSARENKREGETEEMRSCAGTLRDDNPFMS
jgi:hypothetical protein